MIAAIRTAIPVPDAVASFSHRSFPAPVRDAYCWAADLARRYTSDDLAGPRNADIRWRLASGLAAANKTLARHNPRLSYGWDDLPGLRRKEDR